MIKKTFLGALAVGLLTLSPLAPSQATSQSTENPTVVADKARKNLAIISGYVLDQKGEEVNDVLVEVFKADDLKTPLAFQLTYSSVDEDGEEDYGNGWYNIELKYVPGTLSDIKIKYSSLKTVPKKLAFKTMWYPKPLKVKGQFQYVDINDVTMTLAQKVSSTTSAQLFELDKKGKPGKKPTSKINEGDRVEALATVVAGKPGLKTITGEVTVTATLVLDDEVLKDKPKKTRKNFVRQGGVLLLLGEVGLRQGQAGRLDRRCGTSRD